MKTWNTSDWLNSGEYQTDIDAALTNIVRKSDIAQTEADTATAFEQELYFLIRQRLGIELRVQKEKPVNGIVHSFTEEQTTSKKRGRLDAVINNLIIEYKHYSKLTSLKNQTKAYEQVESYLISLYKKDRSEREAILTDGISIAYFSFVNASVHHTQLKRITTSDLDVIIRAILNNNTKKFAPLNIVNDFSISSFSSSVSKDIASTLFSTLTTNSTEKSKMLYAEWKHLMHLSTHDNGKSQDVDKRREDLSAIFGINITDTELEYKALFALQTTYAIIVKLIACKVVDNLDFNKDTHAYHDLLSLTSAKTQKLFQIIEDGYSYTNMGIRNFLEGDFFSWYADSKQWTTEFFTSVHKLIEIIDEYSAFSLDVVYNPIDIFKDLYMSIIPQSVRHSMGEYFTPEWLADSVVSQAISMVKNKNWKAIDPCCGSGIFIVSLIKHIVAGVDLFTLSVSEKNKIIEKILERVYGIDINPLSVLSARVGYFLALHRLGLDREVEIPVYLGDSAIIPTKKQIDGLDCYCYTVDNIKQKPLNIVLPVRLVESKEFGQIMSGLQALVKAGNPEVLSSVLIQSFNKEENESSLLKQNIETLSKNLVDLHKNHWDGIWIRIVTNFMFIARLKSFDIIVGNPPWVKWEHLPSAYTKKIKKFCDIKHIFCNDGGVFGGAQLNICALISNVVASNWLHPEGVLAFLMPDSLMSQNSYEEFRNFYIDYQSRKRLYLQKIDRWMPPLRPFIVGKKVVAQDFNTYYFAHNPTNYQTGIPVNVITKKADYFNQDINLCTNFEMAKNYLLFSQSTAKQLSKKSTAFTYVSNKHDFSKIIGASQYLYRTGVESTPFEIFKLLGVGSSRKKGFYRFRNKILKSSRYKVTDIPNTGWDFSTQHIYPMLEGPSIKPFSYSCDNQFHIIPYDRSNLKKPVSLSKLATTDQNLAIYFSSHKNIMDQQSEKSKLMHCGEEFYALSKIGAYTFAPYIVAARDNSNFCSCVVGPTLTPWNESKHTICVKHTIIISQDVEGRFITLDEAHFINGILNSEIVHDYIHSTFKTNGFSLNKSHLFIPKYNPRNKLHKKLVALSKKTSKRPDTYNSVKTQLSDIYLEICKESNSTQ